MSVGFIRSDFVRKVVSIVCLLAFPAAAQQANTGLQMQAVQSGSQQPGAPPPNATARYIPRDVPPPSFTNAPKIEQLIQNGKLMLSMNDAIAIALADNLDIVIARYNLPIADTDILLTKAGGFPRGVNSGVVSNTPGGGFSGIS